MLTVVRLIATLFATWIALVVPRNAAFAQSRVAPAPGLPTRVTVPAYAQPAPALAQLAPNAPPGSLEIDRPRAGTVPLSLVQAVRTALRRSPALINARGNLELARGATLSARGPFDVALGAGLNHQRNVSPSFVGDPTVNDDSTISASATTNLIWGTNIAAVVGMSRNRSAFGSTYGAGPTLTVLQPLLRNAGKAGFASAVIAGEYAERAADHTLAHVAQLQAFAVIDAYWVLVGADEELGLFQAAAARSQRMLSETQVLVDADQRPRGDLRALEAGYASRRRDVIEAGRGRVSAIHALRLAMGLELAEGADWVPSDSFPAPALPPMAPAQLAERALTVRRDLQAADDTVRSASAAERGADHNTLPRLDLTVSVGYAGATDRTGASRFFDALGRNVGGVNAAGGVNLEVPLENSAARGQLQQAAALRLLAETARADLARNLRTNVFAAYDVLRAEVESLEAARQAETAYAQALDDERSKLRAGLSTVLDTVLTEDLLTDATRSRIGTELALAQALARLRLELGALPSREPDASRALLGVLDAGVIDGQ